MARKKKSGIKQENKLMRKWFARRGLKLEEVWQSKPESPQLENQQLRTLQDWVVAYEMIPHRIELQNKGFFCPPIEPDIDPESDWYRFERWMEGKPTTWKYAEIYGELPDISGLTEAQIKAEVDKIFENFCKRNMNIQLNSQMPVSVQYLCLKALVEEDDFEFTSPERSLMILDCKAYCPGCFQRPWCDAGSEPNWPEDLEAGKLVFPEMVLPYLSP